MRSFLSRFGSFVLFVLSGFDRLRFAGESRLLKHGRGVQSYLWQQQILFKDFPDHAQQLSQTLRQQTEALANQQDVPLLPLNSPAIDKEATALQLAQRQPGRSGRIAVLSCVESCSTYRLRKNARGLIEPRKEVPSVCIITTTSSTPSWGCVTSAFRVGFPSASASASTVANGFTNNSVNGVATANVWVT